MRSVFYALLLALIPTGVLGASLQYYPATKQLCLTGSGQVSIYVKGSTTPIPGPCVTLDPNLAEAPYFDFVLNANGVITRYGAAYYSPAYYRLYEQSSPGVITQWVGVTGAELWQKRDPERPWIGSTKAALSSIDILFAVTADHVEDHNRIEPGVPMCQHPNGLTMMWAVVTGQCYVACDGRSAIQRDVMAMIPRRIVRLNPVSQQYGDGTYLMQSEAHTAVEFYNGEWYVSDPSYLFAYVKNAAGVRLTVAGLIASLAADPTGAGLTFAVVNDDEVYQVSGPVFLANNPSVKALYYTPDKTLAYVSS